MVLITSICYTVSGFCLRGRYRVLIFNYLRRKIDILSTTVISNCSETITIWKQELFEQTFENQLF